MMRRRDDSRATDSSPRKTSRVTRRRERGSSVADRSPAKRILVDHTYIDHLDDVDEMQPSSFPMLKDGKRPQRGPRGGVTVAFPERLHDMLSRMDEEDLEHIVSWQPHGRCFLVHQKKEFIENVMPRFFHQSKLTSFQRQLNLYGFVRLTAGRDRGGYYHQLFLRGRPELCRKMVRTRVKGNGMKAASNPQNEPDFYGMRHCPVFNKANWEEREEGSFIPACPSMQVEDETSIVEDSLPEATTSTGWMSGEAAIVTPSQSPRQSLDLSSFPQSMLLTDLPEAQVIEPTPSCDDDSLRSIESDMNEDPHTGDEVFFEGLKFRYLDHLDLECEYPTSSFIEKCVGSDDSVDA